MSILKWRYTQKLFQLKLYHILVHLHLWGGSGGGRWRKKGWRWVEVSGGQ